MLAERLGDELLILAVGVAEGVERLMQVLVAEHTRDLRPVHHDWVGVALPGALAGRYLATRCVPEEGEGDTHEPGRNRQLMLPYCPRHVGPAHRGPWWAEIKCFVRVHVGRRTSYI